MLFILAAVLLVVWILGFITGTLFGGLTHLLLVVAVVLIVIRMGQGKNPLGRG